MLGRLKSLILDRIYKRINRAVWQPLGGQKPIDYSQMAKFIASYESALFMLENLGGAKHFNSKDELLEFAISQANTPGLWLEFGVYKGGDIHKIARHTNQIVYGFDSFGGLPEDWTYFQKKGRFSLGGTPPEIKLPNIKLIKGLFEDTLPNFLQNHLDPVSFVHIDSDLYSSAKFVLKNIASKSTKGTIVLFDDFLNYPGWKQGESKAFFEWTKEFQIEFEYIGFASQHHSIAVRIL